jgi:hypothetical protein
MEDPRRGLILRRIFPQKNARVSPLASPGSSVSHTWLLRSSSSNDLETCIWSFAPPLAHHYSTAVEEEEEDDVKASDENTDTGLVAAAYPFGHHPSSASSEQTLEDEEYENECDLIRILATPSAPVTLPRLISSKSIPHHEQ